MAGVMKMMMAVAMVVVMMVAMGMVSVEGVSKVETNEAVFFSIGDWGDGSAKQIEVAHAFAEVAKAYKPSWIINVGDNFYESGVTSIHDLQWEVKFHLMYDSSELDIPWWSVLGNHDYIGDPQAEVEYTTQGSDHRWQMPNRYYTNTFKLADGTTVQFVFIDTMMLAGETTMAVAREEVQAGDITPAHLEALRNRMARDATEYSKAQQLQFIEATLANSTADWLFVVGHYPVYSGGSHGNTAELIQDVLPLMQKWNVDAYMDGHDHTLQVLGSDNIRYYVSGGGCKKESHVDTLPQTVFAKADRGFMVHTISAANMTVRVMNEHGDLYYTDILKAKRNV